MWAYVRGTTSILLTKHFLKPTGQTSAAKSFKEQTPPKKGAAAGENFPSLYFLFLFFLSIGFRTWFRQLSTLYFSLHYLEFFLFFTHDELQTSRHI